MFEFKEVHTIPYKTTIEFEVHMSRGVDDSYDFEKLENFIKKQCQLHDGKHDLRIKITGIGF